MDPTEVQRRYLVRRREKAKLHLGGVCAVCGTSSELQFDHVDPAMKVIEIAEAIAKHWSWVRLLTELVKCQLLCLDHHREKTSAEVGVGHGQGASGKRNCPCGPCKARKAEYMASYQRPNPR